MDNNFKKDIKKELDEISFRSYAIYIEGKLLASSLNLNEVVDMATDMFVELMRVDLGYLNHKQLGGFTKTMFRLALSSISGLVAPHVCGVCALGSPNQKRIN